MLFHLHIFQTLVANPVTKPPILDQHIPLSPFTLTLHTSIYYNAQFGLSVVASHPLIFVKR